MAVDDYIKIQQLYTRYSVALDVGDIDAWTACFADDGEFGVAKKGQAEPDAESLVKGRHALREQARLMAGDPEHMAYHWNANPALTVTDMRATGICYFMFVTASDGPGEISVAGHFDDELVKVDDEWLIQRRVIHTARVFGAP